jgi:hypothetical protein
MLVGFIHLLIIYLFQRALFVKQLKVFAVLFILFELRALAHHFSSL